MSKVEGLHHLGVCTANMKEQIDFFADKLGMQLRALFRTHGQENSWIAFLRMNDESSVALIYHPEIKDIPRVMGETHSGNPGANCAGGAMQHVALKVANEDELLAMRDRLRSKGVPVIGPVDHTMCRSLYFAGPENLSLELACSTEPIDCEAWIDPEVVALAGISATELERHKNPEPFPRCDSPVPQPGVDASGPHMYYPDEMYKAVLAMPDEAMLHVAGGEPPVTVGERTTEPK